MRHPPAEHAPQPFVTDPRQGETRGKDDHAYYADRHRRPRFRRSQKQGGAEEHTQGSRNVQAGRGLKLPGESDEPRGGADPQRAEAGNKEAERQGDEGQAVLPRPSVTPRGRRFGTRGYRNRASARGA